MSWQFYLSSDYSICLSFFASIYFSFWLIFYFSSQTDGEDELKKRQLMELAIINGTYRDSSASKNGLESDHMKLLAPPVALTTPLRTHTATSLGAPLIFSPRHIHVPTSTALLNGSAPPPLITPTEAGFLYAPYDFHQYALTSPLLAEYSTTPQGDTSGGLFG